MRAAALLLSGLAVTACVVAVLGVGCSGFGSDDGVDAGSAIEAGGPSANEAGAIADGGAPDGDAAARTDPGVYCAGTYCDPRTELCCTTLPGGGSGCVKTAEAGTCPSNTFACDDGADCAGFDNTVCCGVLGSDDKQLFSTTCVPLLDCKKTSYWVVVCDPNATAACPGGVACTVPDGGGYGFCAGLHY